MGHTSYDSRKGLTSEQGSIDVDDDDDVEDVYQEICA